MHEQARRGGWPEWLARAMERNGPLAAAGIGVATSSLAMLATLAVGTLALVPVTGSLSGVKGPSDLVWTCTIGLFVLTVAAGLAYFAWAIASNAPAIVEAARSASKQGFDFLQRWVPEVTVKASRLLRENASRLIPQVRQLAARARSALAR